ncbi:MAG: hypothetical protein IAE79_18290 [Anaerolinea sp.]|nr:hypothetical protein [Anaerolinea sp.]
MQKQSKVWVDRYLRSIAAMGADFLFVTDLDKFPCVTERLQTIEQRYPRCARAKTQVVVREIESWYLAGIGDEDGQRLRLPSLPSTDSVTKGQFNEIIPAQYRSRRDFMSELLQRFSLQTAVHKNRSFAYFAKKYGLLDWRTAVS